jgi:hypothetical protein
VVRQGGRPGGLEQRDARVFAVINDVQSPSREQVSERAEAYRTEGADVIDLGLSLDRPWLSDPKTIAALRERGLSLSIDALVELRRRRPDAEMLMGIGNLTELTEADSTGITALLIGFCQEVGIGAVLTTEVIGWAHGVVKETVLAPQIMHRRRSCARCAPRSRTRTTVCVPAPTGCMRSTASGSSARPTCTRCSSSLTWTTRRRRLTWARS